MHAHTTLVYSYHAKTLACFSVVAIATYQLSRSHPLFSTSILACVLCKVATAMHVLLCAPRPGSLVIGSSHHAYI